jgi:hypothetical protein
MFKLRLVSDTKKENSKVKAEPIYSVELEINDFHYVGIYKTKSEAEKLYNLLLDIKREVNRKIKKDNVIVCDYVEEVKEELKKMKNG